jgi:hypothetical protein
MLLKATELMKLRQSIARALPFSLCALLAPGCPIYDGDDGCYSSFDCESGYVCELDTGRCLRGERAPDCDEPRDCEAGETCDKYGRCSAGDCSFASVGCVSGYTCSREDGSWQCVVEGSSQGGTGGVPSDTESAGAAGSGEAGSAGAGGEGGSAQGGSGGLGGAT